MLYLAPNRYRINSATIKKSCKTGLAGKNKIIGHMDSKDLLDNLPAETAALLQENRFNQQKFRELRTSLQQGQFETSRNQDTRNIEHLHPGDVVETQEVMAEEKSLRQKGLECIRRGEVALAILNGGMATRFGGGVKGIAEAHHGKSFLGLHLSRLINHETPPPVFLINSFATYEKTKQHLEETQYWGLEKDQIALLRQNISLRLTPGGDLFIGRDGNPSPYAPGHGDVFETLARSSAFKDFKARGGKHVLISNVDNLGATLDPLWIGAHHHFDKAVTVEVASRSAGDHGGAPCRVDGRVEIVEGFRFPAGFSIHELPFFNTNTLTVRVDAIKPYPLSWYRADKEVDGESAIQFERLMGEITSFQESSYIEAPRTGANSRFLPVKSQKDLEVLRLHLDSGG